MRQTSVRWLPVPIALAATLFGCPSVKYNGPGPADGGLDTATGSGGRSFGSGGVFGGGGTGGGVIVPDSGVTDGACATKSANAEPLPLDIYVMMDTSKSMLDTTTSGTPKWDAVKTALSAFFNDSRSAGLGVGLQFFPLVQNVPATCTADGPCGTFGPCDRRRACVTKGASTNGITTDILCADATGCAGTESCALIQQCPTSGGFCASDGTACAADCVPFDGYCHGRDICTPAPYATPAVAIATLPGVAASLTAALTARAPGGYTPTAPALTGAIQYAQQRAQATPDHKVAVVLVTDGLPGGFIPGHPSAECAPSDITGIGAIAQAGARGTPAIPTFVIGVFGPSEAGTATSNLNMLAQSGGTGTAVVISTDQNVTQVLQTELDKIRNKAIACEYKIPPPAAGTGLDFGKVNVNFIGGNGTSMTVPYVPGGKAACDARGGWYYDVDPKADAGKPTSIIACPASCTMFQGDLAGRVDIVLGCLTIVIG